MKICWITVSFLTNNSHSIPKFIIEGSTVIDGAAHSNSFIEVFREIERRGSVSRGPVFGELLGLPMDVVQKGSHVPKQIAA